MAINVDIPPVENEQMALRLMLYHLELAASYFEATPKDLSGFPLDTFSKPAIVAWVAEMEALYPEYED